MNNPLCEPIFKLLIDKKQFKINSLFEELQKLDALSPLDDCVNKDLFKKNFLIMNALYQLQQQLEAEHCHLTISTLHIALESSNPNMLAMHDSLRDYYLDWSNYDTSLAEIEALLNSFWQSYSSPLSQHNAKIDLEKLSPLWSLPDEFTLPMLQKRWRVLALGHHPDRPGGDISTFQRLEAEYQALRCSVANCIK